jgi:hypothetical protein
MAIVNPVVAKIGVVEGPTESAMILIALILVFGAAAYFTGSLYGRTGQITIAAGFVIVVVGLYVLGGIRFG